MLFKNRNIVMQRTTKKGASSETPLFYHAEGESFYKIYRISSAKRAGAQKKKSIPNGMLLKRLAATYFSTNKCSIIGDVWLNFTLLTLIN